MFELATSREIMAPLARRGMKHRLSMFADDVVIFVKPHDQDLEACSSILQIFGGATGLHVNLTKSAAYLIRCPPETWERVGRIIGCPSGTFPCKYLGLPLTSASNRQLSSQGWWINLQPHYQSGRLPTCQRVDASFSSSQFYVPYCYMQCLRWTFHGRKFRQ